MSNDLNRKRRQFQLIHGKDEVKKLPRTVQEEGLMYNPINMHIEDRDRLYEKRLARQKQAQAFRGALRCRGRNPQGGYGLVRARQSDEGEQNQHEAL